MSVPINEIKPGVTFLFKGQPYRCVEYKHIKWAQQARIKLKMKNLRSGAITENTFNTGEKMELAHIEYRRMQFLYSDEELFHFMDQENFNQIALTLKQMGGSEKYIKEGSIINIAIYGDEPLEVQLPTAVELEVVETPPSFKGDTSSGGGKPATLETGLVVQVPFFMKVGDIIKVDSRNGSYIERVGK